MELFIFFLTALSACWLQFMFADGVYVVIKQHPVFKPYRLFVGRIPAIIGKPLGACYVCFCASITVLTFGVSWLALPQMISAYQAVTLFFYVLVFFGVIGLAERNSDNGK